MPTRKAYLAEPHLLQGEATVTALITGERPAVRLNQTYFHPQGGGQKGDRGFIGSTAVLDTKHGEEGEVDHFVASLDGLEVGGLVPLAVDAASRRVNAVNHSAGHLIAAVIDAAFPEIKAVQGHHWPGEARVECEGAINDDLIARVTVFLQPALDHALSEQWPVRVMGDPFVNRSIQFGTAEQVPCGGTHVAHLGQIKKITVKGIKKKGDRLRINYDAEVNDAAF
jgi:Ser-tRNA(Ala) deacylase AlaX